MIHSVKSINMLKKVLIDNIEFRAIATQSKRSPEIISFLMKLDENNAKTITEIYTELNKGKGYLDSGFGRHSVLRTINSLTNYESDKIRFKEIKGKKYYWIESSNSTPNPTTKKALKNKGKEILSEMYKEKILEKDLYPEVQEWLNSFPLDGLSFQYTTIGGEFVEKKSKFSNPDIIGTNIQGNFAFVVSVEVKNQINNESELAGFTQCCKYKVFSDYVFLFCYKPISEDRVGRLVNDCQYYGIGLKFLDEPMLRVVPEKNAKIGDHKLKSLIIDKYSSKTSIL